jgi:hypothetical protein
MRPAISLFSRGLLLVALFVTSPDVFSPAVKPNSSQGATTLASFTTEVRLRKIHLVRPDLIPYPIETEIYC